MTQDAHKHEWQAVGITKEDHVSYSPVSAMDHVVQRIDYDVQSCACGAVRRTIVSRGRERWLNR